MSTITIDVEPQGPVWRVTLGETWLGNFRQPFFGAARELIGRGYSPDHKLQMRHANGVIGLKGTIGQAAKWTANDKRMAFKPWKPFSSSAVPSKSGQVEVEPSQVAGEAAE